MALFNCECGFGTEDEAAFFAHLVECETEPEEKWSSYSEGRLAMGDLQPFGNSEILETQEETYGS